MLFLHSKPLNSILRKVDVSEIKPDFDSFK
jgi:hypothetical protein